MDKTVSVRFFVVRAATGTRITFDQALAEAAGISSVVGRERDVAPGCCVRLEEWNISSNGVAAGDLTRVQTENLPSKVLDDGVERLDEDRIGHGVAFLYDPDINVLATQFDNRAVSPGRICKYASMFLEGEGAFAPVPILRDDAWTRFEVETPTAFELTAAGIRDFTQITTESTSDFEEGLERMFGQYDDPTIRIEVRLGRGAPAEADSNRVRSTVEQAMQWIANGGRITKLAANTLEGDEEIDFLHFVLKISDTLDFRPNDPAYNRQLRQTFVRDAFGRNRDYLRAYREHADAS